MFVTFVITPRQHLCDMLFCEILLQFKKAFFFLFKYIGNVWDEFPASLLQSSVSHDPSEITLC